MCRLDYQSDILEAIHAFCRDKGITKGYVSVIGAVSGATIAYYDQNKKEYRNLKASEAMEIVSCQGNISLRDGAPFAHLHIVLSDHSGRTLAGHLMPSSKVFAGEAYIQELIGQELVRDYDEQTGLFLWKL